MPSEFSRTTARKRITLPNGGTVDVPVITKISFIDAQDRYQEIQHGIDNSAQSNRTVHVDQVRSSGDTSGDTLPVERIDVWRNIDPNERYQETQLTMDNVTGADSTPPHFSAHQRTHVVRYHNQGSSNTWIDSELIDEVALIDPNDRYQETVYTLSNPQTDALAQANPDDPNIADSDNGVDPPWRTDPFQNIIDWGDEPNTDQVAFFTELIWPSDTLDPDTGFSGGWVLGGSEARLGIVNGFAYLVNPTGGHEMDIRFVDQFFEPHTYDTTAGPPGTGDVRGYTWGEWTHGFSPPPGGPGTPAVGLNGLWYDQLIAYSHAHAFPPVFPNNFDFHDYGFQDYLKESYIIWYNGIQLGLPALENPKPVVICRFVALGDVTTANPLGRY